MAMLEYTFKICILLAVAQCLQASVIRRSATTADKAKEEFDRLVTAETVAFLNSMFKTQIDYFQKVKADLTPSSKRAQDIAAYIERLQQTMAEKNLDEKDKMWRETFHEFNKSPLLINEKSETGLTKDEYKAILEKNGLEETASNFLVEVATYFWKMAKASGKVIEATIDEHLENLRKKNNLI